MNIQEALDLTDRMKPNMMPREMKIKYLTEIDQLIFHEIVIKHEQGQAQEETRFLGGAKQMIMDELAMGELLDRDKLAAFIDRLRGEFHREILFKQTRISPRMFNLLTEIERLLEDKTKDTEADRDGLVSFLEEVRDAIAGCIPKEAQAPEYNEQTDPGTALIVPDPYAMLYVYWLMTKIDLQNLEMDKYNNDRALFETAYDTMHDWWNRTYMPVQRHRQLRI